MLTKTFIIAEAGVNHNGKIELAYKLIDAAKESGADAVKFQTFKAEAIVTRSAPKANYQLKETNDTESQYEMIKKLEFDVETHRKLISYCEKKCIEFLSSPFDLESIELLDKLGLDTFKIPSGEIVNLPYLRKIGSYSKKIIMSTGMANLEEVKEALKILIESGTTRDNITILHCNSEYPTPMKDVNLKAMQTLKNAFPGINIGYSDHSLGIEIPISAVALGASVMEKHFTLEKNMVGPDHKASLEPEELKAMVKAIRNIEKALGNGIKTPSESEFKNKSITRKSIVANQDIKKGEIFTEQNLGIKRPGIGISPMGWDEVVGRKANRDYKEEEMIEI